MKTPIAALALGCAALVIACTASAQEEVRQSKTEFYARTSGGDKECGLEFSIVYRDGANGHRDTAAVRGLLTWLENNGNVGVALLIKGLDFDPVTKKPTPFSVFRGFVVIDGKSIPPTTVVKSSQPTDFNAVYRFDAQVDIF